MVFGGRSTEHAVSAVSAGSILAALDPDEYDVIPVGITRAGGWVLAPSDPSALAISGSRYTNGSPAPRSPRRPPRTHASHDNLPGPPGCCLIVAVAGIAFIGGSGL